MKEFFAKYKWYVIAMAVIYLAIAIWLYFFTKGPQEVGFQYQIF